MLVYNLTSKPIHYRGRPIPPNGGSRDYQDLDDGGYIPNRDLKLETDKVLAFGKLPDWWAAQQAMKAAEVPKADQPAMATEVRTEESKSSKDGKRR